MSDETTVKPDLAGATQDTINRIQESVKRLRTHSSAAAPGTLVHEVIGHLEDATTYLKEMLHLHQQAAAAVPPAAPPAKPAAAKAADAPEKTDEAKV